ncbi:MAG: carboxylating nicotinate-nucleotide diphosphorylase [Actinobacteria bacterium]|nr:carboxylating nicotinate-nucleotide diphosphorylase [Actinomycetota bacterium]
MGGYGDITSRWLVSNKKNAAASVLCKQSDGAILSGLDILQYVFEEISSKISFDRIKKDGDFINDKEVVCRIAGPAASILAGERTALNFIQHMSGIATYTYRFVSVASKYNVKIADTRKTKPGLRRIEKYAVSCGGGFNHRFGLFDGVLIKDNHVIAAGGVKKAISAIRGKIPHGLKIEVEVKTFKELKEAITEQADIIMLDNMKTSEMKKAAEIIRNKAVSDCIIEASGGVTLESVEEICKSGVDIISAGCITHSAAAADFSLEFK